MTSSAGPRLTHLSHKADSSDVTRRRLTSSPDCQDARPWEWATGMRFTLSYLHYLLAFSLHYQSFATARTSWNFFYKSPSPPLTSQMNFKWFCDQM